MVDSRNKQSHASEEQKTSSDSDGWIKVVGIQEKPKPKVQQFEEYPDTDVKKPGDLFRTEAEILKNRAGEYL